ncbi:MAG: helix-turn-helix domain-containing protein [Rhodocyclaceae bacterium]|nr:helix-turn-helix domain-containing protein [Rhodocyclaceae bacterium]
MGHALRRKYENFGDDMQRNASMTRIKPLADIHSVAQLRPKMWINEDRVVYFGMIGKISVRTLGAYAIYMSLDAEHRLSIDGGEWQTSRLSVVRPHVPHRVASDARMICTILVEMDTVDPDRLPDFMNDVICADDAESRERMEQAFSNFASQPNKEYETTKNFDTEFFGVPLQGRGIDKRICKVLEEMKRYPQNQNSAQDCADRTYLSLSRFLHLFKQEAGVAFRNHRAWLRGRNLLKYVTQDVSLINVALDTGYPDSSHFSHSVRKIYGRAPRSIFAGSRNLKLISDGCGISPY